MPGVQFAGATQELPESSPNRIAFEVVGQPTSKPEDLPARIEVLDFAGIFRVMRDFIVERRRVLAL